VGGGTATRGKRGRWSGAGEWVSEGEPGLPLPLSSQETSTLHITQAFVPTNNEERRPIVFMPRSGCGYGCGCLCACAYACRCACERALTVSTLRLCAQWFCAACVCGCMYLTEGTLNSGCVSSVMDSENDSLDSADSREKLGGRRGECSCGRGSREDSRVEGSGGCGWRLRYWWCSSTALVWIRVVRAEEVWVCGLCCGGFGRQ
jgi:hypothetical protein